MILAAVLLLGAIWLLIAMFVLGACRSASAGERA
jgi:hypothetical protein